MSLTECDGVKLLGGFKILGNKNLKNKFKLSDHNHVKIMFTVYFIDNWKGEILFLKASIN